MSWLTQNDVDNYGSELLDVSQRAALNAVQPHLQNLEQQNAELQRRLAVEARRNLDQRVAAAVPNYQEIDRDPRWHRWLLGIDNLSGRVRQQLLNDAIASGSDARVAAFFRGFQQGAGSTPATAAATRGRSAPLGSRVYTRDQVSDLYSRHRRGKFSEAAWAAQESDILAAAREGRILNPMDLNGK